MVLLEEVWEGVGVFSLLYGEGQLRDFREVKGLLECMFCFAVVSRVFDRGLAFAQTARSSSLGRVLLQSASFTSLWERPTISIPPAALSYAERVLVG